MMLFSLFLFESAGGIEKEHQDLGTARTLEIETPLATAPSHSITASSAEIRDPKVSHVAINYRI